MHPSSGSALALAREKANHNKAHFIPVVGSVTGVPPDACVTLSIPLNEIERARPGNGQRKSVGFSFEATIDIPGAGRYVMRAAWVAIAAR